VPEVTEATVTESKPRPRDGETNGTAEVGDLENKAGTVTVTGTIPTDNPHYEAVVTDASVHNGALSLSVEVESTLEDGRAGTMPLGVVEYTASVDIEPSAALDSVRIEHPNASYGSSWASDSAAANEGTTSDSGSKSADL